MAIKTKRSLYVVGESGKFDVVQINDLSTNFSTAPMKGIATGSIYLCVDTMEMYMFQQQFDDDTNTEVEGIWVKIG